MNINISLGEYTILDKRKRVSLNDAYFSIITSNVKVNIMLMISL